MCIRHYEIFPSGTILLISGVPGVGKTTVSYELLKRFNEFRIIQETDLIREILRGYSDFIGEFVTSETIVKLREMAFVPDHMKIFNYDELKEQCLIMKYSLENIILRQQRKGISTIINGVHIVPEILGATLCSENIFYINLYINSINKLADRLSSRDPNKYIPHLSTIFKTNCELFHSMTNLSAVKPYSYLNIDVTELNVTQVVERIMRIQEHIIKTN